MAQQLRLTLLGFWLGAMAFFTTSVAQAAFAVLPTRRMAGDLVSPILMHLEYLGIAMSLILLVSVLFSGALQTKIGRFEAIAYSCTFILTIIARFVVAAKIHGIRAQFGDKLDTLAQSDPTRVLFGQLHGISVGLMGLDILIILLVMIMLLTKGRTASR